LKFGESNDAQYHDGGDLQSKQSTIRETLKFFCQLMMMQCFAFYAFSECYFFSEVMMVYSSMTIWLPHVVKRGCSATLKLQKKTFNSASQTRFGRCNLATKSAERKTLPPLPGPYVVL